MKSARKRRVMAVEAPAEHSEGTGVTEVMKSTKRTVGERDKATGKSGDLLIENDENSTPSSPAVALCPQISDNSTCIMEAGKKLPVLDIYPGQILLPSSKIKLQLFPIDEGTCMGLEKDGFHPYLELTLSARKKISSVVKHLNSKWGGSSVALGEPMLFPYDSVEKFTSYGWTINDNGITAADVYAAIKNPAVFRLRYGWRSNSEAKTFVVPSTSTLTEGHLEVEDMRKGCGNREEYGKVKQIEATGEDFKPIGVSGGTHADFSEKMSIVRQIDTMDNEVRANSSIEQSSSLWADSLTNVSIGGLLSEASLQGKYCDAKSNGSNAGLQPSQLISDSFDAFLADQMNHSQGPRPPPHDTHSSILDAEDTCHAFAFPKYSSLNKDSQVLGGSDFSKPCSQDASTKSFKFPFATEANMQSVIPQGHSCQESETDLKLCSRVYNDESSLGLSGINWTDSLGPFDLGLSSSRKINGGDNISLSGIMEKNPELNSASSSTSSTLKSIRWHEESLPASLSPILRSNTERSPRTEGHPNDLRNSPRTEGHPNALRNIQNFALLQASITDIINHREGNEFAPFSRTLSTLDFRTLDPEKTLKLFGLDKD
ncbi:hypothetical protein ACOSQ2_022424 [Xanthoceras sorbifolium]